MVSFVSEYVAVSHFPISLRCNDDALLIGQDDVAFAEQLEYELKNAFASADFERDCSFKLVLLNLYYSAVSQVFSQCHAEGWRLEGFL